MAFVFAKSFDKKLTLLFYKKVLLDSMNDITF
jgi:hypothetical protein